jgi:hypothetical protein
MKNDEINSYPLLRDYLALRGLSLKPAFTIHDVAQIFAVSGRTIQSWVAAGQLNARNIPGRARILPADVEALLGGSDRGRC